MEENNVFFIVLKVRVEAIEYFTFAFTADIASHSIALFFSNSVYVNTTAAERFDVGPCLFIHVFT
jgi:hypothetical protein